MNFGENKKPFWDAAFLGTGERYLAVIRWYGRDSFDLIFCSACGLQTFDNLGIKIH